ncbi:MAG TPA: hypothetical protein VER55_14435 [Ardenticatenaceae bacterium]|nr:hypothetical protein [Ardenticatenaceae bacterium]
MLGPPTETSHFAEWDLVYWMGPEPGLIQVDSVWLVIYLEDDRVTAFQIVTD